MATFLSSNILIFGPSSVQSLLPVTSISQAEALLESHRIQDVIELADKQRKKVEGKFVLDPDEADELAYIYQRIGFQCLLETRFEDAGFCLFQGDLDPRILISYFPDLRGTLLDANPTLEIFSGIAESMPPYDSIDDIILNYSPFLAPTTRSAPSTVELRRLLGIAAHEMLEEFLRKWRRVRGDSSTLAIRAIVDTVLAKLFARGEKMTDLYALLEESEEIILAQVEPVFRAAGQYSALCKMYSKRGDDAALLDLWSKLVEGEWTDPEISDPLSDMFALLTTRRNRTLTQQWGVWLAGKDTERALKLLTAHGSAKRGQKAEDEAAMLQQIRVVNPDAAARFLEHLVLQKRRTDPAFHTELALICIDEVLSFLADDVTSKLWQAKAASYSSSPNSIPFLAYFEATTPASPAKHARLRTALFLQTSSAYDASAAQARLAPHAPLLAPELAILAGKLGNAQEALSLLVRTMHDHTSAAAFCTSHGAVVPPRAATQLAERAGLTAWTLSSLSTTEVPTDSAETKRLLHLLLTIYTADATTPVSPLLTPPASTPPPPPSRITTTAAAKVTTEAAAPATAHLLSSHATFFDPSAVLSTLPSQWPLRTLSLYLVRTLRTTAHTAHERGLIKALATGRNLAVTDAAHVQLRAAGAIVEEALDDDVDAASGDGEELILDEKTVLRSTVPIPAAVDLTVSSRGKTERGVVGSWASGQSSVTTNSGNGYLSNEGLEAQ